MADYCNYSFDDLYKAAFGKSLNSQKKLQIKALSQDEINQYVRAWTQRAEWLLREHHIGGQVFLSFQPPQ